MVLRIFNSWTVGTVLAVCLLANPGDDLSYAKRAKARSRPPDLKILSVDPAPIPFVPNGVPLTLTIKVALPRVIPEDALLDVSTLITSTSRSSFRLLSTRQMLPTTGDPDGSVDENRQIDVVQTWDGTDNNDRLVVQGMYDYQVQVKLMVLNKSGSPLTRLSAWKKRGNFEVKGQPPSGSD
ncbi:MAG TPA: hypothetical protein VGJ57_00580 [Nitrospirales bacterium]|jgi:hypothetical protein